MDGRFDQDGREWRNDRVDHRQDVVRIAIIWQSDAHRTCGEARDILTHHLMNLDVTPGGSGEPCPVAPTLAPGVWAVDDGRACQPAIFDRLIERGEGSKFIG